jgi:deazaflavin-dependent oxidoreductase (nitroreductase family)
MDYDIARRVFRTLNRYFMVPVFRLGLGGLITNPFSGYIMVIKTIGHKSGQERYTPTNYAIQNGNVYCFAGFGPGAHWYRNLTTNPRVELLLPGGPVTGLAEEVTDPDERLHALRQILKNGGFAGFLVGFNPYTAPDQVVVETCQSLPVIRIRPAGVRSGPADPGGWLWVLWFGLMGLPLVWRWVGRKRK